LINDERANPHRWSGESSSWLSSLPPKIRIFCGLAVSGSETQFFSYASTDTWISVVF